jgi:hypothetical protein
MICLAASRAWCQAVDAPLERGVRPRCARHVPWVVLRVPCYSWRHASVASRSALQRVVNHGLPLPPPLALARLAGDSYGGPKN